LKTFDCIWPAAENIHWNISVNDNIQFTPQDCFQIGPPGWSEQLFLIDGPIFLYGLDM
jgi:hypothetical protein